MMAPLCRCGHYTFQHTGRNVGKRPKFKPKACTTCECKIFEDSGFGRALPSGLRAITKWPKWASTDEDRKLADIQADKIAHEVINKHPQTVLEERQLWRELDERLEKRPDAEPTQE